METRDRMLDAAAHVMRTRGLARATTKEIAREAGFSEAALYKHFRDKTDLFLAVLRERVPGNLHPVLAGLAGRGGRGELRANLVEVTRHAIEFYRQTFPMSASLFSEPGLLAAHRVALAERRAGPHLAVTAVADYLRDEQRHGAVRATADPVAAAALLLGSCLQRAFLSHFTPEPTPDDPVLPEALVDTLLAGIAS